DGVYAWYGGAGSTIEVSQIVNNAGHGVSNVEPSKTLLASNNWWGSNSGPIVEGNSACNPSGTGSTVTTGVAFSPFLSSAGADPGPLAAGASAILALAPERWFVPADGVIRAWVDITLRNGSGQPLPGRTILLNSTRGAVVDGGVTDIQGQTRAYVTSDTPGDALLTASLDYETACESASSPSARITFTPASDTPDLLPEEAAPYMNDGIDINPEPVTQGVSTMLQARLKNPNRFPISVNATFGISQLGLGLAFGPVGEVLNQIIPANDEAVIETVWTPPLSGHYCVQIDYSYQAAGDVSTAAVKTGSAQRNLDVAPGSLGSRKEKDILDKASKATGGISKLGADKGALFIPKQLAMYLVNWLLSTEREISKAMGGDPPRQDFTVLASPSKPAVTPVQPDGQISVGRAAALNSFVDAMLDAIAHGRASMVSLDRYGGASEAGELSWAAQQASALVYYKQQMGTALGKAADRLDAFLQVLQDEGVVDEVITADGIRSYQSRLSTQGFSADEVAAARLIGVTDSEMAAKLQEILSSNPDTEAVGSLRAYLAGIATNYRQLGCTLANPPNFPAVAARGVWASGPVTNTLARVFESTSTFAVGNPLTETATINLRVRRVDMPPDWMVTMRPMTVTLPAGGRTTVNVSIEAGSAAVQGTQPRVAIEGYAGSRLLGGVALDVAVPQAVAYDGRLRVYIPAAARYFSSGW
ncbi:MAG: Ig-like domain-containing protein, partial [Dehalococcoidia bacterium]|nr:Ig-like domain-containing protein [Dehalococcoidia bacterium]